MHDIHHHNLFIILATDPEAVVSLPERVTEHSAHIFFTVQMDQFIGMNFLMCLPENSPCNILIDVSSPRSSALGLDKK